MPSLLPPGCLALLAFFSFLVLLPFFFADAMLTALAKLGFGPGTSLLAAVAILFGGMVNLPVRKIPATEVIEVYPFDLFGLRSILPRLVRRRTYILLTVNLGGCVVPCSIAAYELARLAAAGPALSPRGWTSQSVFALRGRWPALGS